MTRLGSLLALLALLSLAFGVSIADAIADDRRSGFADMSPQTQALQRDDGLNPAWLWVSAGQAAWTTPAGPSGKRCADCHGDAQQTMRGVATRYPAFDAGSQQVLTLSGRINTCRQRHQQAPHLAVDSETLLGLEAQVALVSRGLPIAPPDDARLAPLRERGRQLFNQRLGQLDLSCAQCHDSLAGRRLGGSLIPQGHPTAYPIYRLEWQGLGTLQRRLRNCLSGVRAEVPAFGAADLVALELHLMQRAAGMRWESPGVRP